MNTLTAGDKTTIILQPGQKLALTVSADATGYVARMATTPGGGDAQSVTQIAGAALSFGAYAQTERFEVVCAVGTVDGAITVPNPDAVSYDDEVSALLALKADVADPTFTGTVTAPILSSTTATMETSETTDTHKIPDKTPVNAVAANGVVTFTGTPLAFVANVNATGTVTVTGTPVADEALTVGAQAFAFKALRGGVGEITINADNTTQAVNIVAAITADLATVTAVNALGVVTITAVDDGTAGNSLVLTEAATGVAVSGAGTLTGGVDEVPAETVTIGTDVYTFVASRSVAFEVTIHANNTTQGDNLVTAITADDTAGVAASNNAGAVTITAATKGVIGNDIALAESATGTAVSGVTGGKLDGGVNGTVGAALELCADTSYLYYCTATNTISGANWRRVSLGSVY